MHCTTRGLKDLASWNWFPSPYLNGNNQVKIDFCDPEQIFRVFVLLGRLSVQFGGSSAVPFRSGVALGSLPPIWGFRAHGAPLARLQDGDAVGGKFG